MISRSGASLGSVYGALEQAPSATVDRTSTSVRGAIGTASIFTALGLQNIACSYRFGKSGIIRAPENKKPGSGRTPNRASLLLHANHGVQAGFTVRFRAFNSGLGSGRAELNGSVVV